MRKILHYLEDKNIHGIATHLSRCIADYIRKRNIKTIEEFNNINRMEIVKEFLKDKGETFEKFTKTLCIKPLAIVSDEEFFEDLAIYVDLKLPTFYFTLTHEFYDGTNELRKMIKSKYKGIHTIEGLKFHYESNYERELAWLKTRSINCFAGGESKDHEPNPEPKTESIPKPPTSSIAEPCLIRTALQEMQDFIDKKGEAFFESEQNVKNTLLLKLLQSINYPTLSENLHWEYAAGYKSGEKVDCSILKNDTPVCIIEVKNMKEKLNSKSVQNQLKGYFDSLLTVKYAISFNGKEMRIYSDLDHENLMDEFPFHIINFSHVTDEDVEVLKLLSSDILLNDHMALYRKASELKLKNILKNTDSFKKSLVDFIKDKYGIKSLSDSQIENIFSQIMRDKMAV